MPTPRQDPAPTPVRRGRVGLKEVAAAAGVSIATVSLVYNDKGAVAKDTRKRVLAAGRRLGYRPDPIGRALQSGRSRVLGVVVSHLGSPIWERTYLPWFRAVIAGAAIAAVEHGYAVAAVPGGADGELSTPVPLDGVIVIDPGVDDPLVPWCLQHFSAVVTDGAYLGGEESERPLFVTLDATSGVPMLLSHLHDRHSGESPFAPSLLIGSRMDSYSLETVDAYTRWCLQRGSTVDVRQVGPDESPLDAARELVARPTVTAVHCLNETYAAALLSARDEVADGAERIQVSTVGDGASPTRLERAAYLSVDGANSGAAAARILIALLEGEAAASVVMPVELVPAT